MIREIGSFRFWGFYETIFSNSSDFIDDENEIKDELVELMGHKDFSVCCDYENYKEYKKDVCREFMKQYVEKVKDVLPCWITEFKFFKFDMVDDENNIVVISPTQYNYYTDRCYCDVETNIETLNLIKWYTLNLKGGREYIFETHRHRDGFTSHIKNSIDVWKSIRINDYEEIYLIALLDMLLYLSEKDCFDKLHYDVYENIEKWCYVKIIVKYKGKEYGLTEFREKIKVFENEKNY